MPPFTFTARAAARAVHHSRFAATKMADSVDRMPVEELRATVRQLVAQRTRDQATIKALRAPLLTELAQAEAQMSETEAAEAMELRLRQTLAALEDDGEGLQGDDWGARDWCMASCCAISNLLAGVAMAALAAALLMSQPQVGWPPVLGWARTAGGLGLMVAGVTGQPVPLVGRWQGGRHSWLRRRASARSGPSRPPAARARRLHQVGGHRRREHSTLSVP
jgi:hypothetical protein